MSTRRAALSAYRTKQPRGPNGEPLCRECGGPVRPPRRTFCSDACVQAWQIRTQPAFARMMVERRDHGVCARCGLDCTALAREFADCRTGYAITNQTAYEALCATHGLSLRDNRARFGKTPFWEAHHKVAVVEGGGECGLDGYETLCWRCHRDETAALARRRAEARSPQMRLALGDAEVR